MFKLKLFLEKVTFQRTEMQKKKEKTHAKMSKFRENNNGYCSPVTKLAGKVPGEFLEAAVKLKKTKKMAKIKAGKPMLVMCRNPPLPFTSNI